MPAPTRSRPRARRELKKAAIRNRILKAALELFRESTGLARAAELKGVVGKRLSLGIAVATATVDRRLSGSSAAPASTREMLRLFLRCALTLAGVASVLGFQIFRSRVAWGMS